ncbi:hypothetical protein ES703_30300 [subsurface metagenome]
MKDYEIKEGASCHVFLGAESYEELLSAILNWWSGIRKEEKTLEAITFVAADNGVNAYVYWNYLTKKKAAVLHRIFQPRSGN